MNRPRGIRRRSDRRSAGGNYWCQGPAPRRRRFPRPANRPLPAQPRLPPRPRPADGYAAFGRRLRAAQGHREAACHGSSKMSFRGPLTADEELPFTETLAARRGGSTAVHMAPCPIRRCRSDIGALSAWEAAKSLKNRHFRYHSIQDHTSSSSLENAIALQKFGVGQPVRHFTNNSNAYYLI